MGLEGVEIVLEIEDEFGIKIPDEDCERILTVGGMAQYIEHRLYGIMKPLTESRCTTGRVFYALRRAMMSSLGLERDAVRPKARLRTLVPYSRRQQFWEHLERTGLRAPPLGVAQGVQLAVIALAGVVGLLLHSGMLRYGWPAMVLVLWIPLACVIALYVLRRSNAFLPASCQTVGDLARQTWLEHRDAETITEHIGGQAQVFDRVRTIIAEELRIPKDSVRPDTRFGDILP